MKKRTSQLALLSIAITLIFFQSCIDETYDLAEDNISLEVNVGGSNLAIPIGSTDSIFLGNIIPEDNELIALNEDSVYSISMSGSIDPISLTIDPISLNIGSVDIDPLSLEFGSTSVPDFAIDEISTSSNFDVPETSISDMNLPTIVTDFGYSKELPVPISVADVPVNETLEFDGDPIGVAFDYDLAANEEVKTINIVYLGSDENGDRFAMNVDVSAITSKLNADAQIQIVDFHITFPEDFTIAKDETSPLASSSTINGSVFNITNYTIPSSESEVEIVFYIQSLDLTEYTDNINFNKDVTYGLNLSITGTSNGETINSFDVSVTANNQLSLNYADITTNDIAIESDISGSFKMATSIDGLEDLKSVNLIDFASSSVLQLQISNLTLPLDFSAGEMQITFPTTFEFNTELSTLGDATLSTNNVLTIPATSLFGSTILLVMNTLDLSNKAITDGILTLDEAVSYEAIGLTLGSKRLNTTELAGLGTKTIDITVPESQMSINSATVTTNSITADVEQSSVFELNEEVPDEIQALQTVSLTEDASIAIAINFEGVPAGLGSLTFDNFEIQLPRFIQFDPSDNVVDGVLSLNEAFNPTEGFNKILTIKGIDFTTFGASGLETTNVAGKNMLTVTTNNEIKLIGGVKTSESTLSSDDLDGLVITPSVKIDELTVGTVVGTFDPQIDPIDESIELDLGDGLDFLKEANIRFNNPQIFLTINSNIGLPVDLSMALQGKDADGNIIEGSVVDQISLGIKAADVIGESTASKFLLSELGTTLPEYDPVQIDGISNLLQTLPDQVSFQINAESDKTQTHKIDLNKPLTISGDYEIVVPLEFDEFEINFDTIISGMSEKLGDLAEIIGDAVIQVHATIANSIPLAFNIEITPIDIDGDTLTNIATSISDTIAAGNGVDATEEDLVIRSTSENDALYDFDGFIVHLNAKATSTVGGVALRDDQFIQIKDILILIEDGINLDLNNLGE